MTKRDKFVKTIFLFHINFHYPFFCETFAIFWISVETQLRLTDGEHLGPFLFTVNSCLDWICSPYTVFLTHQNMLKFLKEVLAFKQKISKNFYTLLADLSYTAIAHSALIKYHKLNNCDFHKLIERKSSGCIPAIGVSLCLSLSDYLKQFCTIGK